MYVCRHHVVVLRSCQVLAIDANFNDWLGYKSGDIVGSPLWSLVAGDRATLDR